MKAQQRLLLGVAVVCLAIGILVNFCGLGASPLWTLALPLGAVFLGLYLIALLGARFEAEQVPKTEFAGVLTAGRPADAAQATTPPLSGIPPPAAPPPHRP